MTRPTVHLYTVCWEEADMLGFFFRHYDPWVDRYIIYDDGSTDGSIEILSSHPKVELRRFVRADPASFVLSHREMQNEVWKESRGKVDWVVVTAIDEHLWVRGRPMPDYLAVQKRRGTTLIPAIGFDMNHPVLPEENALLIDAVTHGRPRSAFNKLSIFNPDAIRETGFAPGRHAAEPVGELRVPARDELMLWHYKHLGFERNEAREARQAERLGPADIEKGFGQQYRWSAEERRRFWDEMLRQSTDLAAEGVVPEQACIGPLWWRDHPRISSSGETAKAEPTTPPTVSVLVKSFNHAAYVGQTIESVLAQSFQDFEIVVTDDGSTDGTLDVLRRYADPRIRIESFAENQGISVAMNATIARARGRYLAILNSDDWALPDRLQRQMAFLDTHHAVSAVFSLPYPVDEHGDPTSAFNDFAVPLSFPDFSPRYWLRHFFDHGNCLCAPTAMIRRQAYDATGPYDPRLTNLQDFDMWVRMLIAGHTFHVMAEPLTAFRIRDNNANMSAPRPDTRLRSRFETIRILRHFASLDQDLFEDVFGTDPAVGDRSRSVGQRLAELACRDPRIECQNLGLELLFDIARDSNDFLRLRILSGTVDALAVLAIEERDRRIAELTATLAGLGPGHWWPQRRTMTWLARQIVRRLPRPFHRLRGVTRRTA